MVQVRTPFYNASMQLGGSFASRGPVQVNQQAIQKRESPAVFTIPIDHTSTAFVGLMEAAAR